MTCTHSQSRPVADFPFFVCIVLQFFPICTRVPHSSDERISRFAAAPDARLKSIVPDLGQLLVAVAVSRVHRFEGALAAAVVEVRTEHVVGTCPRCLDLFVIPASGQVHTLLIIYHRACGCAHTHTGVGVSQCALVCARRRRVGCRRPAGAAAWRPHVCAHGHESSSRHVSGAVARRGGVNTQSAHSPLPHLG